MAPTGNRLPLQTCNRIRAFLDDESQSAASIAVTMGVSKRTIERMRLSYELFNSPYPPPVRRGGRPSALTAAQKDVCDLARNLRLLLTALQWVVDFMMGHQTAYLEEVSLELLDVHDVDVGVVTLWRVLLERRWSRKVVRAFAAQRSEPLRVLWRSRCQYWHPDKLCFVDESATNEKTGYRKRGWSPVGIDCIQLRQLKRSERWSVLPALTVNGYLNDPLILQGSVTKAIFQWWLLNKVIPFLLPGSVIVMDNASIHHNLGLEDVLEARGLAIAYLPPYSPDLNPIENTFNVLKAWIRRNWEDVGLFPVFGDFLAYAARQAIGQDMTEFFRHCHYNV